MVMERVHEFPHTHMDRRPRKRARLGWDVLPPASKLLAENDALKRFKSHKKGVRQLKRIGDVLTFVVIADKIYFLSLLFVK